LTAEEWEGRFVAAPAFDAQGLILAVEVQEPPGAGAGRVIGGVHALRPPAQEGIYQLYLERHHIAWLLVAADRRGQGIGSRLLQAAENFLYYCPVSFAAESAPLYGTVEGPRPPLFGSSQRMGVSLTDDRPLIDWLARRGYGIIEAGDVSLTRTLDQALPPPPEPDWEALGLRPVAISRQAPWTGPGYDELRLWQRDGDWPYGGTVLAGWDGRAVGRAVWCPQGRAPANRQANVIRLDVAEGWRDRGLGAYLLDRTLRQLRQAGYRRVEVQTHLQKHVTAFELYRRRRFAPEAAWANLVKQ
jgi:GNAT superfamily N-acetyltransferase